MAVLRTVLRAPDAIGRVGGDEFLVLLPGTDPDRAEVVAARLREALRRAPLALDDGTPLLLSMSCGVAGHRPGWPSRTSSTPPTWRSTAPSAPGGTPGPVTNTPRAAPARRPQRSCLM